MDGYGEMVRLHSMLLDGDDPVLEAVHGDRSARGTGLSAGGGQPVDLSALNRLQRFHEAGRAVEARD